MLFSAHNWNCTRDSQQRLNVRESVGIARSYKTVDWKKSVKSYCLDRKTKLRKKAKKNIGQLNKNKFNNSCDGLAVQKILNLLPFSYFGHHSNGLEIEQ